MNDFDDLFDLDKAWNKHFRTNEITPPEKNNLHEKELCPDCNKPFDKCAEDGCVYYSDKDEEDS